MVDLAVRRAEFDAVSQAQRGRKGPEELRLPYKYEICPSGKWSAFPSFNIDHLLNIHVSIAEEPLSPPPPFQTTRRPCGSRGQQNQPPKRQSSPSNIDARASPRYRCRELESVKQDLLEACCETSAILSADVQLAGPNGFARHRGEPCRRRSVCRCVERTPPGTGDCPQVVPMLRSF